MLTNKNYFSSKVDIFETRSGKPVSPYLLDHFKAGFVHLKTFFVCPKKKPRITKTSSTTKPSTNRSSTSKSTMNATTDTIESYNYDLTTTTTSSMDKSILFTWDNPKTCMKK